MNWSDETFGRNEQARDNILYLASLKSDLFHSHWIAVKGGVKIDGPCNRDKWERWLTLEDFKDSNTYLFYMSDDQLRSLVRQSEPYKEALRGRLYGALFEL